MRDIQVRITADGVQFKRALQEGANDLNTFSDGANKASEAAVSLTRNILGLAGLNTAMNFGKDAIATADGMSLINARLTAVTASAAEYRNAQYSLLQIANDNQQAVQSTITLYTKLAPAIKDLGGSQATAMSITRAFSDALRVGGANTSESASATLQFAQAMESGVLRGDEFNSMAEASQRIMRALADGMHVPIGALRQMAEDGQLTADVVGNALVSQMEKLRAEAAVMPKTGAGSMQEIHTAFATYISDVNTSYGVTQTLAGGLSNLATNLDTVAAAGTLVAGIFLGRGVGALAGYGAAQVKLISHAAAHRTAVIAEVAALEAKHLSLEKLHKANMGLSTNMREQIADSAAAVAAKRAEAAALTGVARAAGLASRALAMVGGPLGALVVGASIFAAMATNGSQAAAEVKKINNRVEDLNKGLLSVSKVDLEQTRRDLKEISDKIKESSGFWSFGASQGDLKKQKALMEQLAAEEKQLKKQDESDTLKSSDQQATQNKLDAAKKLTDQYKNLADQLREQIALYGNTSEAAKTRYQIEHGELSNLSKARQKELVDLAKQLDAKHKTAAIEEENYQSSKKYITDKEKLESDKLEREQAKAKAWADAEAAAYNSTRTPMEQYIARQKEAARLRDESIARGMNPEAANEVYNRQTTQNQSQLYNEDPQVQQTQQQATEFFSLADSLKSDNVKVQEAYLQRAELIRNALAQGWTDEATAQERMQQLHMEYREQIGTEDEKAQVKNTKLWNSGWQGKAQVMSSVLGGLTQLMQSHSKKQFEIGKQAARAQTVIDTIQSAQSSYKALSGIPYVGPILGAAAAAAAIAAGAARLSAINSTQFGGGSTGVSVGAGGVATGTTFNGGAPLSNYNPSSEPAKPVQQINVYINGSLIDNGMTQLARELRPYQVELAKDTI